MAFGNVARRAERMKAAPATSVIRKAAPAMYTHFIGCSLEGLCTPTDPSTGWPKMRGGTSRVQMLYKML